MSYKIPTEFILAGWGKVGWGQQLQNLEKVEKVFVFRHGKGPARTTSGWIKAWIPSFVIAK